MELAERQGGLGLLQPSRLLEMAQARTLPAFAVDRQARRILLVRIPTREPELLEDLRRAYGVGITADHMHAAGLDLQTVITEMSDLHADMSTTGAPRFGASELRAWLDCTRCIAVPLSTRRDDQLRTVVGRSRTASLSLRARSVSKIHAYFESGPDRQLLMTDPGSRNGTFLNGARMQPGAPQVVMRGDQIRFGDVETLLCPTEVFWNVVHVH